MFKKVGGLFMTLLGVVVMGFSIQAFWIEALLDTTGQATTGMVTDKTTSEDEDHHTSYFFTYRFEDRAGHSFTSRSDVGESMYDIHLLGAPIPVVYAAGDPAVNRVRAAGGGLLEGGALAAIGVLSAWFGLWMYLRQARWEKKVARLTKIGERVVGRLVAVEDDKSESYEGESPKVLVYEFTDKTGQPRTGRTFHVRGADESFWQGRVGCALEVRVNPADLDDHTVLMEESKLLG